MKYLALLALIVPALFAIQYDDVVEAEYDEEVNGIELEKESQRCPRACDELPRNDCECPKGEIAFLTYTPASTVGGLGTQLWQCVKIEASCNLTCGTNQQGFCISNRRPVLPHCRFPDGFFAPLAEGISSPASFYATFKYGVFTEYIGSFVSAANDVCLSCKGKAPFCAIVSPFPDTVPRSIG